MIDRYLDIIHKTLEFAWRERTNRPPPTGMVRDETKATSIEPFAWAMVGLALGKSFKPVMPFNLRDDVPVVDTHGYTRAEYRGLAFHVLRKTGDNYRQADMAHPELAAVAPADAHLAERVWFDLDDVRWSESQSADGALVASDRESNPESTWYAELVLLHALTTSACTKRDEVLLSRARLGANYVAREIQPDHASTQPWAIHAMLLDVSTLTLADFMLHSAGIQQPSSLDSVSLLLLADALHSLSILRSGST